MQLRYLNEFRDEITSLDEPRPDPSAQAAENRARRERLEQEAREIRERAEAVHREREEEDRFAPPAAPDPSASVLRRQLLAQEEERLARETAENLAEQEALARKEREDALGRAAAEAEEQRLVEEMVRAEEAAARDSKEARRLREEEELGLELARSLEMEGFVCESCQEHLPVGDVFRLAACSCDEGRRFCIECMRGWVQGEIGSQAAGPPPVLHPLPEARWKIEGNRREGPADRGRARFGRAPCADSGIA
jgi:hypothetical protein